MSDSVSDIDDDEEEPIALPRPKFDDSEADITPMIDMTFLLLIFFVVTSTMDPAQIGKIPKAINGLNVPAEESVLLFLSAASGDKAVVTTLEGREFSSDENTQTSEIVDFVTQQLDQGKKQVMIFGDDNVRVGEVTRVQRIIGDAFETIDKTYIAVQEAR